MKRLIILIILCSLTTYAFSSQFTDGNHEVESSLKVHDTDEPIVFFVDSSTHRVGVNSDSPLAEFDVSEKFQVFASQVTVLNRDFAVDIDTLFVDSENNRVGIGTLTPDDLLEVKNIFYVGASQVTVSNNFLKVNTDNPTALLVENDGVNDNVLVVNTQASGITVRGTAKIGDGGSISYSEIEEDGTLKFNGDATVWDDLRVAISSVRVPASLAPTWTAWGSGQVLAFSDEAVNEELIYFITQMPHSYKQGSDIDTHVHWLLEDATDCDVRWQLTCDWINMGGVLGAADISVANCPSAVASDTHTICGLGDYTGTGKTVSAILNCILIRNSSDPGDTCTGKEAYLLEVDFHYELDTVGSRQENIK